MNGRSSTCTRLEVARQLLARGIVPVPVPLGSKRPTDQAWQKRVPTADELPDLFPGDGNIGINLGEPSGWLVDVDLDCSEAVELADRFLPPTPVVTGRPGNPRSHRWYIAKGSSTRQFRDPVIDTMIIELRSTGGQTLVGPSSHPDCGETYELFNGAPAEIDAAHLLKCVQAIAEAVIMQRYPEGVTACSPNTVSEKPDPKCTAESHVFTSDPAIIERARKYLSKMPPAISGRGGHARAYAAATCMVHGFGLEPSVAFRLLREEFNPRCEPPWSDKELWHKVEDAATKSHSRPYRWLADSTTPITVPARQSEESKKPLQLRARTEQANAELLAELFSKRIRHCGKTGVWYVWTGTHWEQDECNTPGKCAAEMTAMLRAGQIAMPDQDSKGNAQWLVRCESRAVTDNTIKLATALEALSVRLSALDADQYVLNALNGTIDLRTGDLHPHRQEDLITKVCPVRYSANAECPRFMQFLEEAFPDSPDAARYLQKLLGYCLSGDIAEQHMHIFHGAGANGKSVLIEVMMYILGPYACIAPPSLIADTGRNEHPVEIATLLGRRLVVASETEKGCTLKLQQIKRLTGDAQLTGRFMRQDYVVFDRSHKLIMLTNNRPHIKESGVAAWRRMRLVPFDVVVPENRQDKRLSEKFKQEASGILAWAVQGCIDALREGLGEMPNCLMKATEEYRSGADHVERFIEDYCECAPANSEAAGLYFEPWSSLLQAYVEWTREQGETALSPSDLGAALEARGHHSVTKKIGKKATKVRALIRLRSGVTAHEI